MALLGYKKRFVPKIRSKAKRQTVRAFRKFPIKVGETLYMYTGLRTKSCKKILQAKCKSVELIHIHFKVRSLSIIILPERIINTIEALNEFAKADGFKDWYDMREFWYQEHGRIKVFKGNLIKW